MTLARLVLRVSFSSTLVMVSACGPAQDKPSVAPATPAAPAPAPAAPAPAPQAAVAPAAPVEEIPRGREPPTEAKKAPDEPIAEAKAARTDSVREAANRATQELEAANRRAAAAAAAAAKASAEAAPPPAAAPPPEPAAAAPAPRPVAPAAGGKVSVPHTDHVSVSVPAGLQKWLDADTRMQPWVNKVMSVADKCYASERASNADAAGTIEVRVTMHKDDRPDADVQKVPASLGGMIACATGDLLRTRMPLFTGDEGDHYTVKITFSR